MGKVRNLDIVGVMMYCFKENKAQRYVLVVNVSPLLVSLITDILHLISFNPPPTHRLFIKKYKYNPNSHGATPHS